MYPDKCTDEGPVDDPQGLEEWGGPSSFDLKPQDYQNEDWGEEGYEVVDPGEDPGADPEGGDWEALFDEPMPDLDEPAEPDLEDPKQLKKSIEEEEKLQHPDVPQTQKEAKEKQAEQKRNLPIPKDPSRGPEDYHQFWDSEEWHVQESRKILEKRAADPTNPEDAQAARDYLLNGPKIGRYHKAPVPKPGEEEEEYEQAHKLWGPEREKGPII
jgi:hypothetical protein